MSYVLGLIYLLMAALPVYKTRSVVTPYTLVAAVWGAYLLLFGFFNANLFPLGERFYVAITLWVTCFYIGALNGEFFTPHARCERAGDPSVMKVYFIVTPVFALVSAWLSIRQALSGANFFLYLRAMSTGLDSDIEGPNLGVFAYLTSLILILFLIEIATYGTRRRKVWIPLLLLNLLLAFISMAKTALFSTACSALVILLMKRNIRMRAILICVAVVMMLFVVLQTVRGGADELDFDFITRYIFTNSVAFDRADMTNVMPLGSYVFRLPYAIGHALGLCEAPVPVIMEWIAVGPDEYTNTYTALYPFYHDFGMTGVAVFAFLTGLLCGCFYKRAKNSIPARVFYSLLASSIVFQMFGEVLYSNASSYLQYLFYAYLPFILRFKHGRHTACNIQRC